MSAIVVCGIGAPAPLAVFGTPGMLLITLSYIAMAVPTAARDHAPPSAAGVLPFSSRCGRTRPHGVPAEGGRA